MTTSGSSESEVLIGDVWRELRFEAHKWPRGRVDVVDVVEIQGTRVVFYQPLHVKDPIRVPLVEFLRRFELRYREGVTKPAAPPPAPGPESVHGMEGVGKLAAAAKAEGVHKLFTEPAFEYDAAAAERERAQEEARRLAERGRREQRAVEGAPERLVADKDLPF